MAIYRVARIEKGDKPFHIVKFDGRSSADAIACNAFIARMEMLLKTKVILLDDDERWYGLNSLTQAMQGSILATLPWQDWRTA